MLAFLRSYLAPCCFTQYRNICLLISLYERLLEQLLHRLIFKSSVISISINHHDCSHLSAWKPHHWYVKPETKSVMMSPTNQSNFLLRWISFKSTSLPDQPELCGETLWAYKIVSLSPFTFLDKRCCNFNILSGFFYGFVRLRLPKPESQSGYRI